MTIYHHAVVAIDDRSAKVLQFDDANAVCAGLRVHRHPAGRRAGRLRPGNEYFAHICSALIDIPAVLLAGSRRGLWEFRRYVEVHRPYATRHIVGYQVVDHPTDAQLVAMARDHFARTGRGSRTGRDGGAGPPATA